ncbi:MAG: SDR family oxidoreductase [Proteobacteria bacterium]|nr:SDR family oxidoreductase [Pseudomonadota bacterium]
MQVKDKVIVVTGGGNGIGKAMCRRFAQEGARAVVVSDIDEDGANAVASEIGGLAVKADVSVETDVVNIVKAAEEHYGPIDLFCSNAGIISSDEPDFRAASCPNEIWQKSWDVHVMAHVYAARAVLPGMIDRGEGYLLNTASAAGLLSQIGSAPYSATKHAAIGFAEALAIAHDGEGVKVSVVCPQAVRTDMVAGNEEGAASVDGIIEPEDVAESVIQGLAAERFLILPHPEVITYIQRKTSDYDRWLQGMSRFRKKVFAGIFGTKK